jgi:hypothetical protein
MDFSKYKKLEKQLETNSFELNFSTLDKTLYWFSFLGNIAIIYFSYYFFADVVNSIPDLAGIKAVIFLTFAVLIMTGYELFKRFAFEQFIISIFKNKHLTAGIIGGGLAVISLTAGSFYLSLNGSHRWIDRSTQITANIDSTTNKAADSISNIYLQRIKLKEQQIQAIQTNDEDGVLNKRQQNNVKKLEEDVKAYEAERDQRVTKVENKTGLSTQTQLDKNKENNLLLTFLTFFLELVVLIGVGFRGYYTLGAYNETKDLFSTPKYRQLEECLQLLSIVYVKGKKRKNDIIIPATKLKSAVSTQKLNITQKGIKDFYNLLDELEIIKAENRRRKVYNVDYETARKLMQQAFID